MEHWVNLVSKGTAALGKDWTRAAHYKKYLEEAGFEGVTEKNFESPVGTWARGKRINMLGSWGREDMLSAVEGISLAVLTRGLGVTKEEVHELLVGVRDDMKSDRIHIYIPV